MKKFIIIAMVVVLLWFGIDTAFYRMAWYIDFRPDDPVTAFARIEGEEYLLDQGDGFEPFEIKGVNMGSGIPGKWATDFAADKETYLRWFGYIKAMGANTLRIYTVQNDTFYNAFYEYNKDNPDPLWLIHGVWVNDYIQNSHRDAYADDFINTFIDNCKTMIDVVHGKRKISLGRMASAGHGSYLKDISPWVIGYILGVEWEDVTVVYTDRKYEDDPVRNSFKGEYMYTSEEATPFEAMLARVGDQVIQYESKRYKSQRPIAFSNWPTTDPFEYPDDIKDFFMKCAEVDVEHILCTEKCLSGQFVSYHVYPYYPDYMSYVKDWSMFGITDLSEFYDSDGDFNTYRLYLKLLCDHHTMPVVISEFGVSTGRGMAQRDRNTGRNQGNMSENEQGEALVECYHDIKAAGCSGCCVFSWQDEWFKRTWNTMYAVNLKRTPYWSDYQTNEQYFGLLSFDPGDEKSVCYVDGDISEWVSEDLVSSDGETSLYMKYDEKFIYFMIKGKGVSLDSGEKIYLPIDTTPKSGSNYYKGDRIFFDRQADFIIELDGKDNSRVKVQERYEALRSTYSLNVYSYNTYLTKNIPDLLSPEFVNIDMILQTATPLIYGDNNAPAEVFETGKLTYGNANPESPDFNSLADFIEGDGAIEIKLPWQLLNFSDPSRMTIHDDYYEHYGVDYLTIKTMYVGLSLENSTDKRITLAPFELNKWGNKVTYHERLKKSYYVLKDEWTD